jgi:hypothetical protein
MSGSGLVSCVIFFSRDRQDVEKYFAYCGDEFILPEIISGCDWVKFWKLLDRKQAKQ